MASIQLSRKVVIAIQTLVGGLSLDMMKLLDERVESLVLIFDEA